MEFELPKINVSFEYDEEKDEIVFVINGVEKRVKTEDMITEMEKLQEQNTALEQQPCGDCISRAEAQKRISIRLYESALNTVGYDCKTSDVFKDIAEKLSTCISEIPSVQPKPKTGHWIMSDDGLYRPICNKCGAHPWKGYIPTVEEATEVFKYCPNCGAKMLPTDLQFGDQDTLMSAT